jgi:hypothetical protein
VQYFRGIWELKDIPVRVYYAPSIKEEDVTGKYEEHYTLTDPAGDKYAIVIETFREDSLNPPHTWTYIYDPKACMIKTYLCGTAVIDMTKDKLDKLIEEAMRRLEIKTNN